MKLSVIIPVYNVEKYLVQCLDSVVNQTHKDLEIIIVDDGSTDGSGAIVDNYAKQDPRIIAIHKQNGGLVSAYCEGYKYATAELVTFVDSDDWCDTDMYERMLNAYCKYDVDLVVCSYIREYKDKSIKVDLGIAEGLYSDVQEKFFYKINERFVSAARWNKIFKKCYLNNIMKNVDLSISFAEDNLITIPYVLATKSFYFIDEALYHYRYTAGSCISKSANYKIVHDVNNVHKLLNKYDNENKYTRLIDDNTLELYFRVISNFNDVRISDNEKKVVFARLAKEKLFRNVLQSVNWHCDTMRQRLSKLVLKISPSIYFKIIIMRARSRNGAR